MPLYAVYNYLPGTSFHSQPYIQSRINQSQLMTTSFNNVPLLFYVQCAVCKEERETESFIILYVCKEEKNKNNACHSGKINARVKMVV